MLIQICRKALSPTSTQAALWVDGCRVGLESRYNPPSRKLPTQSLGGFSGNSEGSTVNGRWPANVILTPTAAKHLDDLSGMVPSTLSGKGDPTLPTKNPGQSTKYDPLINFGTRISVSMVYADFGGASRFFWRIG